MWKWSRKVETMLSRSLRRSRPLSTRMQTSWSPMAWWSSEAVTEESTPPLRPQMTLASPTCLRTASTVSATKVAHLPVAGAAADVVEEVLQDILALGRVADLRVELDAVELLLPVADGGVGQVFVEASVTKSVARLPTWSP
jgi:hypothetical protein